MTAKPSKKAGTKKLWAYPHEDFFIVTDVPPSDHDVKRGWCEPVTLLRHSDRERLVGAVKVALDTENGTGAGYDYAAYLVLKAIGVPVSDPSKPALGVPPLRTPKAPKGRKTT